MKLFLAFAALLLIAPMAFCQAYTYEGWLEVGREISTGSFPICGGADTGACHDTGAISGNQGAAKTTITLTLKNAGTADREGIMLTESLTYVPDGVKISFYNAPSETDGRSATWAIGALRAGESKSVSYSLSASLPESQFSRMIAPQHSSEQLSAVLSAPIATEVGSRMSLSLMSSSGQPISNATLFVHFPDGTTQAVKTGEQGTASVIASKQGFYTYSAMGYRLIRIASTEAKGEAAQAEVPETASAAASTSGTDMAGSVLGFLPTLAAIFAVLFILIMAYNFITSRRESDEGEAPASSSPQQGQQKASSNGAGFVYTQKFSFAEDAKREERVREVTHGVLESRKRQMSGAGSQPAESPSDWQNESAESAVSAADSQESALSDEEVDESIGKLESEARLEGEAAEEDEGEESLEATIAKLEEIRQRLRERQSGRDEVDGKGASMGEGEEIASVKEEKGAPAPRRPKPVASKQKSQSRKSPKARAKGRR